jgi:hypothetical protein
MQLDGYLRAHGFMVVERPPVVWEVDCSDTPFLHLLGEMIVMGLLRGTPLPALVLNVSNVSVGPDAADDRMPEGEFVAVSVRGGGVWGPDVSWAPGEDAAGPLCSLEDVLPGAGASFAYVRVLGPDEGSVTAWLPRLP